MNLDELIKALIHIAATDPEAKEDEVYFMHGARTYRVTGVAYDPDEDVDVTLTGTWTNPR